MQSVLMRIKDSDALIVLLFLLIGCIGQFQPSNVSEIVSITASSVIRNWDADAENDGIAVDITFWDDQHDVVSFEGVQCKVIVRIFTLRAALTPEKDRLVYEGTFMINGSNDVDAVFHRGIQIPFEDINVDKRKDPQFGIMEITVEIPNVGRFSASDEFATLYE